MEQQNTLLANIKLPGRMFQLPSRGCIYHNGELDASVKNGELHIYPMSTMAEISIKNPDMLFNGTAFQEVFAECVPGVLKPLELAARDIDAIMYFLRVVTYGPHFVIEVAHTCSEAKNHSYIVNLDNQIAEMRFLDPTTPERDWKTILPNGQKVKVGPIRYVHLIELFQANLNKAEYTVDDLKKNAILNLANLIQEVDGITDKSQITEWVKSIPSPWANRIAETSELTNTWGTSSIVNVGCKDCGETMKVELPLNPVAFFTE